MSKSYKSVSELTKGWNEDDFFDIAHLQMIESYEGIDEEPFFDTIVEMVIKTCLVFKDLKTNEEVPFNDTMLENPRTLGSRYNISLRPLRGHLNRNSIWKFVDRLRLLMGSIGSFVDATISFYDVKASFELAKIKNNKNSKKEWKKLMDDGFVYLPNDGTHKVVFYAEALLERGYFDGVDAPMFNIWEKQKVLYWIKESQHIEHWSENYLYSTYGKTPVAAAIRTGIGGKICQYVKDVVTKSLDWIPNKLSGVKEDNHGDEDIYSKWTWFYINDSIGTEDEITDWYVGRKFKPGEETIAKKVIKIMETFEKVTEDENLFSAKIKGYYFWLWLFLNKKLEEKYLGVESWDRVVKLFVEKLDDDKDNNEKVKTKTTKGTETENLFKDLLGGMTSGYFNFWFDTYTNELIDYIKSRTTIFELDKNRSFTANQRREVLQRDLKDDGRVKTVKVRVNGQINGEWYINDKDFVDDDGNMIEYVYREYVEVVNNRIDYQPDHIKPWSKGGKTEVENCEITSTSYNKWKNDRT